MVRPHEEHDRLLPERVVEVLLVRVCARRDDGKSRQAINILINYFQGVMTFGLIKYKPLRLDAYNYDFPMWGHVFGWFLSLSSMLCIPIYAIYLWCVTEGTFSEVRLKFVGSALKRRLGFRSAKSCSDQTLRSPVRWSPDAMTTKKCTSYDMRITA